MWIKNNQNHARKRARFGPVALRLLTITWIASGCAFRGQGLEPASDADVDSSVTIDAGTVTPWITAAVTRPAGKVIVVQAVHVDGGVPSLIPCTEVAAPGTLAVRDLLAHPTLPLVYGVESGFHSFGLSCSGVTISGMENVGSARPVERIVADFVKGIGFFTMDGSGTHNVFRFTIGGDGTPTMFGSGDATSAAGPLAFDSARESLFVAGPSIVSLHAIVGPTNDFPSTHLNIGGCTSPLELVVSGDTVLEFCTDLDGIRRYQRTPSFAFDTTVGSLGRVDRVVTLPGDRAVAAVQAPPGLALLSLNAGSPTMDSGPGFASRITALAASPSGAMLATARQATPTTSELAVWQINAHTIELVTMTIVDGTVNALAVTNPGT